jgi:peptidyl-prolyl cis-trans isomerase A (cyclophilin A)
VRRFSLNLAIHPALAVALPLSLLTCSRVCGGLAPPDPAAVFGTHLPAHAQVTLDTDVGAVHCQIDPIRVPRAASLFAGLARGEVRFRDPRTGEIARRRYYDGLPFFRRIPGVLVQSGCPLGDGSGHPGYRVPVETSAADRELLSQPGALLLAHYQPPPFRRDPEAPPADQVIGSQFVVALVPMTQNLGQVTVLGRCADLERVERLSTTAPGTAAPLLRAVDVSW